MSWQLVFNDLKRNKTINIGLLLLMVFSATLAILSVIMTVQTLRSIDQLYQIAQPPHFLQMHKGDIDEIAIDEFMQDSPNVTDYQIVKMINIYGEDIQISKANQTFDLSESQLDLGFVKQNPEKDLLLNGQHEKIILSQGQIGVPIILKDSYDLTIGDTLTLYDTYDFVISDFVVDAQMNSTLASSTRFLLSDDDFNLLEDKMGENEFIIETYFTSSDDASAFQTTYENAGLAQNGQAVTYRMMFILSAFIDMVTVFVILLVSILALIVAFICMRFTILASIEEEIREIGILKAIGFSFHDIRDIYLNKYRLIAVIAVSLGYLLAFGFSGFTTNHITATFGEVPVAVSTYLIAIAIAALVYLLIILYSKRVLKSLKGISVVDALNGKNQDQSDSHDGLYRTQSMNINWILGLREIRYKKKDWAIVFAVTMIAMVIILVPVNLLNTLQSPEFVSYMGSSQKDMLIEIANGDSVEASYQQVKAILDQDDSIEFYQEERRVRVQTFDVTNELMNLTIDSGQNAGSGLQYLEGRAPIEANEIALSYFNEDKIGKSVGDSLQLEYNNTIEEYIIVGIYQDVTSGGFTAKATNEFNGIPSEKYSFSIVVQDWIDPTTLSDYWTQVMGPEIKVYPMTEFIDQTLGGVSQQLNSMIVAVVVIAIMIVVILISLFLKLRLVKDHSQTAIMKAIGFSSRDIQKQYLVKVGTVALVGILAGIVMSQFGGNYLVNFGLNIAGIGIKEVQLIANNYVGFIAVPVVLISVVFCVTLISVQTVRKQAIMTLIAE
ncbi:FtsX-like permease family protein [Fundicoccus culcitae]|uniref:ABC transporter permease n=1 Tax=Fundicoccus culcitae TaxID=2969821 RepID=A0ABY5P837_9LACT|nr:ABC transporter permease [Fundicoccus culcitae]UUX34916.1 ABC transporter permease [Fundicoccus culcitae]